MSAVTAYAFVPSRADRAVTVVDMRMGAIVAVIRVGTEPWAVAATADGRRVYVTNASSNTISVIDVATTSIAATLYVQRAPQGLALTPDGRRVYVTNTDSDSLTAIDVDTNVVSEGAIAAGTTPWSVAITPDGRKAFVVNTLANAVSVLDLDTERVDETIGTGALPFAVVITPDGKKAFVTNGGTNTVTPIDVATYTPGPAIPVGILPEAAVVTLDGRFVFVANGGARTVSVIDVATHETVATIAVAGTPVGLAIPPHGRSVYVSTAVDGAIVEIDVATRQPVGRAIPVGAVPSSAGFTPNIIVARRGTDAGPAAHAVTIDGDADLAAMGFRRFVTFSGGRLRLAGPLRTVRHVSLLAAGGCIDTNGFDAAIEGDLLNDGGLRKEGRGTLALYGAGRQRGDTILSAGTLLIEDVHDAPIRVEGGTLGGGGVLGDVVAVAGVIHPGGDRPATLRARDVALSPGVTFLADVRGPVAGTDYGQLVASGTVLLNDATLTLRLRGRVREGMAITLVTNARGTFAGLPEDAVVSTGSCEPRLRISYRGGTGQDVVLTVLSRAETSQDDDDDHR